MLPGPVFNVELLTTARRPRYFVLRAAYGLFLLYLLWQAYESHVGWWRRGNQPITVREVSWFALGIFRGLVMTQGAVILLLTPALFAGAIADEKQRKTLHYLMASQLTSGEIVLGKLAARLLHVGVFLAVGLPIISLLTLLGGVPPAAVVASYAICFSTAWFLAGLSLLVSTYARRVRDALIVAFVAELFWLAVPPLLDSTLRWYWFAGYDRIRPVLEWIIGSNPLTLLGSLFGGPLRFGDVARAFGLHLACGSAFVVWSVLRLRPVFRRQSAEARPSEGARRRWPARLLPRPALRNDPMLWKELHVARPAGLVRWVVRVAALFGAGLLSYWLIAMGEPAVREWWRNGYGTGQPARREFGELLRVVGGMVYTLWGLGLAAAASASISAEREEDTWISLLTTSLRPDEIVLAKIAGALWSGRALGVVLVGLWSLGAVVGAIHPVGFVAALVAFAAYSAFVVGLGTLLSLKSRNTTRAAAATVGILLLTNGLYLFCCIPLEADPPLLLVGCTPFLVGAAPISYDDFRDILLRPQTHDLIEGCFAYLISVLLYGSAGVVLVVLTIADFDATVDRPGRGIAPSLARLGPKPRAKPRDAELA